MKNTIFTFKKLLRFVFIILIIPALYLLTAVVLSFTTVNKDWKEGGDYTVYLSSNGVHLDLIFPIEDMDSILLSGLVYENDDRFLGFGWGDKEFYLNTPHWNDLTFTTAWNAIFSKGESLMHLNRYAARRTNWVKISISNREFHDLSLYVNNSFRHQNNGTKVLLRNQGYTNRDYFYLANGSYSLFNTSNTWTNTAFKEAGLKAALWTPFDFGLLRKYK